jgi:hypothetical protein
MEMLAKIAFFAGQVFFPERRQPENFLQNLSLNLDSGKFHPSKKWQLHYELDKKFNSLFPYSCLFADPWPGRLDEPL